jgi:hypothetical protein
VGGGLNMNKNKSDKAGGFVRKIVKKAKKS